MARNQVSASLSPKDLKDAVAKIEEIKAMFPFLITLTNAEKLRLAKFGDKSLAFARKTLALAQKNQEFLPRNFSVEEMEKDVNLYEALYSVIQPLNQLLERVMDTFRKTGDEAYQAARIVYNSAKLAGRSTGGLDAIMDDLGRRFQRKSNAKKKESA